MAINQYNQGTITSASRVPVYDTVNGQPRTVSVNDFSAVVGQTLTTPDAIPGYSLVLATVGAPDNMTGSDGMLAVDAITGAVYKKAAGSWALLSAGAGVVALTVSGAPVLSATVGQQYAGFLVSASGGVPPYTYSDPAGSLPDGLSVHPTVGLVSGVPTTAGESGAVALVARDVLGNQAILAPFNITAAAPGSPLDLSGSPVTSAQVGVPYSFSISASGGEAPYTYAVASGALPAGVTLSASTGLVSGTPTSEGTVSGIVLSVTDATSAVASLAPFSVTVAAASVVLAINGTPPTTATVGTPYNFTPTATGGTAPYAFALIAGTLPAGLSFNTSTGAVTGTPTTSGSASGLSIRVTDNVGATATLPSFGITVSAGATVPGQPAAPTATAGDGTVSLAGAAPSTGGSPILEYGALLSNGGTATSATLPISVPSANGQAVTGQIRARNAIGWGEYSPASNSVTPSAGTPTVTADYIVYGANAGGLWGAMKAADLGLSVAVINEHPANRLGGMLMGIMHTDIQSSPPLRGKGFARGLVDELYRRVAASFTPPLSQEAFLTQSLYGMRPEFVWAVMNDMLTSRGITIYHNEQIVSVAKTGAEISELVTTGRRYVPTTSGTCIDATYHGDLLDKAGVATFVGRESSAQYGEADAGIRPLSTNIHSSVSPYVVAGDPGSGLLPGISAEPHGTVGDASPLVQVCTIRLCHRADLGKSPAPSDYDPLNYELLRRNIIAKSLNNLNQVFDLYNLQDAGSWDVNNGPQTGGSLNYTGPEMTEYVTATHARRLEIELKVKNYILGLIHFLRTEPTLANGLRTEADALRIMNIPVFGGDGFPANYYLRQGRSMVGGFVLKQADVTVASTTHLANRIAKVIYPGDRHWSRRVVVNPGASANVQCEGGMALPVIYSNAIPRQVLLPQAAHCTNVMPTFCVSASAIAQGSIRMEVLSMQFGVATAAIAKARKTAAKTVQAVTQAEIEPLMDYWNLYDTNGGAIVAVPNNTVPAGIQTGVVTPTGTWTTPSGAEQVAVAYGGAVGQPGAIMRFAPNLAATGVYEVRLCWHAQSDVARNAATIVRVVHAGGTFSTTKNQNTLSSVADTGDWGLVGGDLNPRSASQFTFNAGSPSAHYVEVEIPASGGTGLIGAVKFIRIS